MSNDRNPTNSEGVLRRQSEYNAFIVWYGTPSNYRGLESSKLTKLGLREEYHELMSIKTHSEFAAKYDVNRDTLTDWKKRTHFNSDLKTFVDRTIFQNFYSRVATSFTLKTIESGDAARMMAWMKMFAGHIEKVETDININDSVNVESILDGADIMDIVTAKLVKSGRISKDRLKEIASEVEDVNFEELPSQQQYDFTTMSETTEKVEEIKVDEDIKSKLAKSLAKIKKRK